MSPRTTRRRLTLALTAGLALAVGIGSPAGADKPPALTVTGGDHWFTHDVGWFPVVQGPAEVQLGRRTITGDLSAVIQPDDHTMPAPGECEGAITFVFVEGAPGADLFLSSAGQVCGHWVQEPTSVVTHSFTGTMTVEESDRRGLEGDEGFLDIRMAQDGRAFVFATVD
jgi:hypothetical protein